MACLAFVQIRNCRIMMEMIDSSRGCYRGLQWHALDDVDLTYVHFKCAFY